MKVLLVYPPFCTPTILPYSLASLKHFLQTNLNLEIDVLDLNAEFHKRKFAQYYKTIKETKTKEDYAEIFTHFDKESREVYAKNNREVLQGKNPEYFQEIFSLIKTEDYDIIACSLVYNSQCFYATAILKELQKQGIICLLGGPAAKGKVLEYGKLLKNEHEIIEFFTEKGIQAKQGDFYDSNNPLDFSDFKEENYLSKERIFPIKTSSTCFYKQCTFCTHFAKVPYKEYEIAWLENTLKINNAKYVFLIDDMLTKERLMAFAQISQNKIQWACQLRPTPDILGISKELYAGGLRSVSWGVESGSQRILDLMKKGTDIQKVPKVLKESHEAGIQNILYIMFAFPTETKEEFMETINFLEKNQAYIDLVCTSIFGLQHGAKAFESPQDYGIIEIKEKQRTVLEGSITYKIKQGLNNEEARVLQKKVQHRIDKINKIPKVFKCSREQTLLYQ
ncbi:MAG TPA: radical SAM protein [Nanoarchaeota archaeon]|nr:radical SAM protein [Candidatus Woesearchaeota archaeon]HIH15361.1 radical SAM protein [Nanoarchaeota archaeon]HIH58991.1 radical SAM protein [Nanoarchaeota archaeon]HII13992.1 radical SAM protein [Nanoarchaeota archaeon]HIJ05482.1 radical SAM protein [Nanoarchaeota archaeon]